MRQAVARLWITALMISPALAQSPILVTPHNFVEAETDMYFGKFVSDGALGKFVHTREPAPIDQQSVIRMNRDTIYSQGVFDLDAGPVTVTMPDAGKRFMSLQVIDEDHYTHDVFYKAASHTFTRKEIGTRYLALLVRTLIDPNDPDDIKQVHALQDAIRIQQSSPGKFEVPNWDDASRKKVHDGLLLLASTMTEFKGAFGAKGQVDPINRLIGTAAGWGGNPDKDATYLGNAPAKNDGATIYRLDVKNNVPVDGFWSISVYNAKGYFEPNPQNAYTLNNITAKANANGSVPVQFGGCDGNVSNCLPITPGWNYLVRLYRPRSEVLDGRWTFPEAKPAD
jgi:hypothetical protein